MVEGRPLQIAYFPVELQFDKCADFNSLALGVAKWCYYE